MRNTTQQQPDDTVVGMRVLTRTLDTWACDAWLVELGTAVEYLDPVYTENEDGSFRVMQVRQQKVRYVVAVAYPASGQAAVYPAFASGEYRGVSTESPSALVGPLPGNQYDVLDSLADKYDRVTCDLDGGRKTKSRVKKGSSMTKYTEPVIELGELVDGRTVLYQPGGITEADGVDDYVYRILDDGVEADRVTVKSTKFGGPERDVAEMLTEFADEYGWAETTADALVLAHGDADQIEFWPDEYDDAQFIGLVEEPVSTRILKDMAVGLYLSDGTLTPYVLESPADCTLWSNPEAGTPRELPPGPRRSRHTYDMDQYGSLKNLIQQLEAEEVWYEDGFPHELTHSETVTGHSVQVNDQFCQHLEYPDYVTVNGEKQAIQTRRSFQ